MTNTPRLLLASASPRRRELLQQAQIPFEVRASPAQEQPWSEGNAAHYALSQASLKAEALLHTTSEPASILGADTVVVSQEHVFGKPIDRAQAASMLSALQGQRHQVITAFYLCSKSFRPYAEAVTTQVMFRPLSPQEIEGYLDTNEWEGKAGAYAIQGIAGAFVRELQGSYTNVVGLPITEVVMALLRRKVIPHFPLVGT